MHAMIVRFGRRRQREVRLVEVVASAALFASRSSVELIFSPLWGSGRGAWGRAGGAIKLSKGDRIHGVFGARRPAGGTVGDRHRAGLPADLDNARNHVGFGRPSGRIQLAHAYVPAVVALGVISGLMQGVGRRQGGWRAQSRSKSAAREPEWWRRAGSRYFHDLTRVSSARTAPPPGAQLAKARPRPPPRAHKRHPGATAVVGRGHGVWRVVHRAGPRRTRPKPETSQPAAGSAPERNGPRAGATASARSRRNHAAACISQQGSPPDPPRPDKHDHPAFMWPLTRLARRFATFLQVRTSPAPATARRLGARGPRGDQHGPAVRRRAALGSRPAPARSARTPPRRTDASAARSAT